LITNPKEWFITSLIGVGGGMMQYYYFGTPLNDTVLETRK
jgi:hypothetical protein